LRAENEVHERMAPRKASGKKRESLKEVEAHEGCGSNVDLNRRLRNTDACREENPEVELGR
jgi:hypothetical protein